MLTDVEAAWLSGFIDGEGYVGLHAQRHGEKFYYQVDVQIQHTHWPTVERVVELLSKLGIEVTAKSSSRAANQKDAWHVAVTGMDRVLLLADYMEPFTVTKREQWALLREWISSRKATPHKAGYTDYQLELAEVACNMNRRGRGKGHANQRLTP